MNKRIVPLTYTRILVRMLHLSEFRTVDLLAGTDLKLDRLLGDEKYIPLRDQYQIIENAIKLAPDRRLGAEVGSRVGLPSHGLVGVAALAADTLLDALTLIAKFYELRAPFFDFKIDQEGSELVVSVKEVDSLTSDVSTFLLEAVMSMIQSACEQIIGRNLQDGKIIFSYPEPHHAEHYDQVFNSQVVFVNQEYCQYRFPLEVAKTSIPTRDQAIYLQAELDCRELLAKIFESDNSSSKVKSFLFSQEGKFLSLTEVAKLLSLSPRSLIRRLKKEGTSYQQLLDDERKKLANQYLADPGTTIEVVALALGYEYIANFRRAFKRWYGITPSKFRQQLIGSGGRLGEG